MTSSVRVSEFVIRAKRHDDHWEVEVELDGKYVGGGTGGSEYAPLDIASDILFGDTNDRLNDYHGALGQALKDEVA